MTGAPFAVLPIVAADKVAGDGMTAVYWEAIAQSAYHRDNAGFDSGTISCFVASHGGNLRQGMTTNVASIPSSRCSPSPTGQ
jgi:hypothetical protein